MAICIVNRQVFQNNSLLYIIKMTLVSYSTEYVIDLVVTMTPVIINLFIYLTPSSLKHLITCLKPDMFAKWNCSISFGPPTISEKKKWFSSQKLLRVFIWPLHVLIRGGMIVFTFYGPMFLVQTFLCMHRVFSCWKPGTTLYLLHSESLNYLAFFKLHLVLL